MLVVDGDTMCMVRYTDRAIAMLMPSGRAPERPRDVTKWQQSCTHVTILEVLLYKCTLKRRHPEVMIVVDGDTMCTVQYTDRAIAMVIPSGRAPERPLRDVTKWQQPCAHVVTVAELLFK